jgi:hypothetical protein
MSLVRTKLDEYDALPMNKLNPPSVTSLIRDYRKSAFTCFGHYQPSAESIANTIKKYFT